MSCPKSAPNNVLLPCSLSGAICAIEGIREAVALINGPIGCKLFASSFIDLQDPEGLSFDPKRHASLKNFFQPRVPCTYLMEEDVIFGSETRLLDTMRKIKEEESPGLIGIVNSCTLGLIGDNIAAAIKELPQDGTSTILIESSGFTGGMAEGFQQAVKIMVHRLMKPPIKKNPRSINIVGLSIGQYNWYNDLQELKRMFERVGIAINTVLTAGTSLADIVRAPEANLNVVFYDEYGGLIAREMEEVFGLPYLAGRLPPYGTQNTQEWLRAIASVLGVSADGFIEDEARRLREKVRPRLSRISMARRIRGLSVAIFAEGSAALSLASFFYDYLGLEPALLGLKTYSPGVEKLVKDFLQTTGLNPLILTNYDLYGVQQALAETEPELILGSSLEKGLRPHTPFINIGYPVWDKVILTERPFLGYQGVLTLLEELLNAILKLP